MKSDFVTHPNPSSTLFRDRNLKWGAHTPRVQPTAPSRSARKRVTPPMRRNLHQRPPHRRVVAEAGRAVRRVRAETLQKLKGGLRGPYRTLELSGANPLKDAHAALDTAVLNAYKLQREKRFCSGQLLALTGQTIFQRPRVAQLLRPAGDNNHAPGQCADAPEHFQRQKTGLRSSKGKP